MSASIFSQSTPIRPSSPEEPWLDALRERVRRLRFGTVQLVIHEGRVMQIESTEKIRFGRPQDESA